MPETIDLTGPIIRADHFGGDRNCWGTPSDLFDELHAKYHFTVDACALPWNTKLPRYWAPPVYKNVGAGYVKTGAKTIDSAPYPLAYDGLAQDWTGERVWCNPPYGRGLIEPWVEMALYGGAALTVLLLPSRTDTAWFHKLHRGWGRASIQFLPRRIRFVPPAGVKASSPTEASIVVVVR